MRLLGVAAVAAGMALSGCVSKTGNGYSFIVDTWIGSPEINLVRSWGAPTRTYEAGGSRFVEYVDRRTVSYSGTAPTYHVGTDYFGNPTVDVIGGIAPSTVTYTCRTTFEISRGVIVGWNTSGNDCIAYPPTAEELCEGADAACLPAAQTCLRQTPDPRRVLDLEPCMRQFGFREDGGAAFVRV